MDIWMEDFIKSLNVIDALEFFQEHHLEDHVVLNVKDSEELLKTPQQIVVDGIYNKRRGIYV